jgi:hypothetical protein
MAREYNSVLGSGTTPNVSFAPPWAIPPGTFPVPDQRTDLRNVQGEGIVCLNPEDASVSIGFRAQAITISGVAAALPASPLEYRRALVIHNNGSSTIYLGNSDVTSLTGFPLSAGEKIAFDIKGTPRTTIYAISGGSSVDVRIMELA